MLHAVEREKRQQNLQTEKVCVERKKLKECKLSLLTINTEGSSQTLGLLEAGMSKSSFKFATSDHQTICGGVPRPQHTGLRLTPTLISLNCVRSTLLQV